ncbi:polysaccharide pyruvyl transferase family protein [Zhouia spongiae]|uniref:Polysaccharide pyruvyl transferase family protein n=1 Tax=Zhouia spongiae TaxID=2202721 RepID=A0ABY3YJK4_9FLAO|nr:polysaccharide pyruvyl transferase family protein [Zhouia spongiae]UNY97883.1 polysaccharide pyruvyl transferase family protein [Zhouia spongiae]
MKFVNKNRIEGLKNIVRKELTKYVNSDYVLLDLPNHRNIGDLLIWEGELSYLQEINHKLIYSCNLNTYQESKISEGKVILLHGGGNFGDVWKVNQEFRNNIISKFKNNRIIIFPQTIHYNNQGNLSRDAELYNSHPDLIICVRDTVSYDLAKKHFYNCTILLMPDMAFFVDLSSKQTKVKTNKTLIMRRYDKELGNVKLLNKIKQSLLSDGDMFEEKDWPGFYKEGTLIRRIQAYLIRAEIIGSKKLLKIPFLCQLVDDNHGLKNRNYKNKQINKGIKFINEYDKVYSTRLHGFILSVLLNKEIFIFDNSYGKNKNFFNTWLSDFEKVKLIGDKG